MKIGKAFNLPFLSLFWLGGSLLFFIGCSDISFNARSDGSLACSEDPSHPCHHTALTLRKIQPSVAVRGISCLMCHAQIKSNIITDFGLGTSSFFGGSSALNDESWFNNYVNAWQSADSIQGSAFVPDAYTPRHLQNSVASLANKPDVKILEFMNTPYQAQTNWTGVPTDGTSEMSVKISPPGGAPKVIAKSQILIRAPGESEISNLAPGLFADPNSTSGFYRVSGQGAVQFQVAGSGQSTFVRNIPDTNLICTGSDIVVRGPLYLRNLKVEASGGCRLYVSGTVFIEGPIQYQGGENQNLQITSANGIFLGIDLSHLAHRLVNDHRGLSLSGERSYSERANQVMAEALKIGTLKDASSVAGEPNVTADYRGNPRVFINYSGLLLNAPMVHSRYLGVFKGTIVAEAALFSLGRFHFEFDPVFTKVNILPLLKESILSVR